MLTWKEETTLNNINICLSFSVSFKEVLRFDEKTLDPLALLFGKQIYELMHSLVNFANPVTSIGLCQRRVFRDYGPSRC